MSIIWELVLTLHILTIAYWIGGSMACLQLRRATRLLDPSQASLVQLQYYTRFMRALLHVVPICLATGAALMIHAHGILAWPYHLMALCGIIMTLIFCSMFFGPFRTARRSVRPSPALFTSLNRQSLLMMLLGMIAVLTAALGQV